MGADILGRVKRWPFLGFITCHFLCPKCDFYVSETKKVLPQNHWLALQVVGLLTVAYEKWQIWGATIPYLCHVVITFFSLTDKLSASFNMSSELKYFFAWKVCEFYWWLWQFLALIFFAWNFSSSREVCFSVNLILFFFCFSSSPFLLSPVDFEQPWQK